MIQRLVFAFLIGAWCLPGSAATLDAAERTQRFSLASEVLGETREILVRTPPGAKPGTRYPVVYVLDAEWNFELVASHLDYLADNQIAPPVIVTGVTNVNRNRDFVPRADRFFDDTGQAATFLSFVKEEWVPHIDAQFASVPQRVLIGHSFGGVFTLHALFSEPELFDAYIALGSSAWIAERVLFEQAETWFEEPKNADAFVYMAVGEGDGGPTVPSSQDLAALFELKAPATLDWTFSITPRTDHFTNVVVGLHQAFLALFPAWEFDDQLKAAALNGGSEAVNRWFDDKQEQLGWRFEPAWFDVGVVALELVRQGAGDAALATLQRLGEYHTGNVHVVAFQASVLAQTGDHKAAIQAYQRAIEITEREGLHPNEMHLDRLRRGLARSQEALATLSH